MRLSQLNRQQKATVLKIIPQGENDTIAERLSDIGFIAGEPVRIVSTGPFGRDPLLVQIGFTRFALRLSEADRIMIELCEPIHFEHKNTKAKP